MAIIIEPAFPMMGFDPNAGGFAAQMVPRKEERLIAVSDAGLAPSSLPVDGVELFQVWADPPASASGKAKQHKKDVRKAISESLILDSNWGFWMLKGKSEKELDLQFGDAKLRVSVRDKYEIPTKFIVLKEHEDKSTKAKESKLKSDRSSSSAAQIIKDANAILGPQTNVWLEKQGSAQTKSAPAAVGRPVPNMEPGRPPIIYNRLGSNGMDDPNTTNPSSASSTDDTTHIVHSMRIAGKLTVFFVWEVKPIVKYPGEPVALAIRRDTAFLCDWLGALQAGQGLAHEVMHLARNDGVHTPDWDTCNLMHPRNTTHASAKFIHWENSQHLFNWAQSGLPGLT